MGLWCEMRTRRGALAWTRGHGKWGTFVSSTATVPCTENTFRETLLVLLLLVDSLFFGVFYSWGKKVLGTIQTLLNPNFSF